MQGRGDAAGREGAARGRGRGARADCRTGAQDRPATVGTGFFSASLAASRGSTPAERRAWRAGIYAVIATLMSPRPQGELTVERMCALAGVSRAGYYRHLRASLPRQEEAVVRDAIQRVSLANRRYGYRRIAAQ